MFGEARNKNRWLEYQITQQQFNSCIGTRTGTGMLHTSCQEVSSYPDVLKLRNDEILPFRDWSVTSFELGPVSRLKRQCTANTGRSRGSGLG